MTVEELRAEVAKYEELTVAETDIFTKRVLINITETLHMLLRQAEGEEP